jgi:hypothetical protein
MPKNGWPLSRLFGLRRRACRYRQRSLDGQSFRGDGGGRDDDVRLWCRRRLPALVDPGGVTVETDCTGGHLLHLAAAGCVLNDLYREAAALGIELAGVRVTAAGGFDTTTWESTGIEYRFEVSSAATAGQFAHLLDVVDRVAEIQRAIRAGATVRRVT